MEIEKGRRINYRTCQVSLKAEATSGRRRVWSVAPNSYAAIVSVVAHEPKASADYKRSIPSHLGLVHVTVEVHPGIEEPMAPGDHVIAN